MHKSNILDQCGSVLDNIQDKMYKSINKYNNMLEI